MTRKKCSDNRRDRIRRNSTRPTVLRLKPGREVFGAFACVAGDTAPCNILARDDARVIDDVLPRWRAAPLWCRNNELDSAVDTTAIPVDNLAFEPSRDVPSVHEM